MVGRSPAGGGEVNGRGSSATRVAVWFLYSTSGEPLGQLFRAREEAVPRVAASLADGATWKSATVVDWTELASACEMRRFRVAIRVLV